MIEPGRGSHMSVTLGGRRTVIAIHPGDIKPGTFRAIMKQLDINERDL
ncbi:MAG: type II toxin-antitoxin system HicA family toxin [Alphaproteobacteria bacterium]